MIRPRHHDLGRSIRRIVTSTFASGAIAAALIAGASSAIFTLPQPAAAAPGQSTNRAILGVRLPELKLQGASISDSIDFIRDVSGANIHVNWRALEAAGISKEATVNLRLRDVTLRRAMTLLLSEAAGGNATLTFYIDDNVLEVTTKELADRKLYTRVFPVQDLVMEIPDFPANIDFDLNSTATGGSRTGGHGGGGASGGGSSSSSSGLFGSSGSGSGSGSAEKVKTKQERAEELVALIRDSVAPEIWRENGGQASIRYYNGNLIITAPRSVMEAIGGPLD